MYGRRFGAAFDSSTWSTTLENRHGGVKSRPRVHPSSLDLVVASLASETPRRGGDEELSEEFTLPFEDLCTALAVSTSSDPCSRQGASPDGSGSRRGAGAYLRRDRGHRSHAGALHALWTANGRPYYPSRQQLPQAVETRSFRPSSLDQRSEAGSSTPPIRPSVFFSPPWRCREPFARRRPCRDRACDAVSPTRLDTMELHERPRTWSDGHVTPTAQGYRFACR